MGDKSHHPPKVFPKTPRAREFLEVNAVRQGQQSARDAFHPVRQIELKGPTQCGRGREFVSVEAH